jgi:hypothetical protein
MKAAKVGADITGNVQVPGSFGHLNNAERAQAYLNDEFFLRVLWKNNELLYISNIVNSSAEEMQR